MRLISDAVQKAAEAKETNVTRLGPRYNDGASTVKVISRGSNVQGKKPNNVDDNPLKRQTSGP